MSGELEHSCPWCGKLSDRFSGVGSKKRGIDFSPEFTPQNGDVSICIDCGSVSVFDFSKPGNTRRPTKREQKQFDADPTIQKTRAAWKQIRRTVLH